MIRLYLEVEFVMVEDGNPPTVHNWHIVRKDVVSCQLPCVHSTVDLGLL